MRAVFYKNTPNKDGKVYCLTMEEETVFQKIISGDIPADKVYETEQILAFLDIKPVNKGHTLVIPKKPVKDIFELSDEDAAHLMKAIVTVAKAVKKATKAPGINVSSNNGSEAGQVVFHLHFHIIPRFKKEEFSRLPHTTYESDDERAEWAKSIVAEI